MINNWFIFPIVPGEFHHSSKWEENPRRIVDYIFCFDYPQTDDLFTSSPEFFVTERLAESINANKLTGVKLQKIKTKLNHQYIIKHGEKSIPDVYLLKFDKGVEQPDFAIVEHQLRVSDKALEILKKFTLSESVQVVRKLDEYEHPRERFRRLKKEGKWKAGVGEIKTEK